MADINRQQVEQIGNGAAEVVRRGAAEARTTADVAQQTTHLLWAGSQDMWRMLPGQQGTTPGNLPELSQAFAGLFGDMLRTNLRIGQELVRLANPVAMIELQQKLVHGYLDAIVASQAMLLGAARGTAEDPQRQASPPRDQEPQGR